MDRQPGGGSPLAAAVRGMVAALSLLAFAHSQQHNVLMVIADDLGVDAVGCYSGMAAAPTPNIDALAAGGLRFVRAHSNPACTPTRGTIMTGRHAFRTGTTGSLGGGAPGIDPQETLLPTALAGTGYARALIGKWHLGTRYGNQTPNTLGWPWFVGVIDSGVADYYQWPKVRNGVVTTSTRYITTDEVDETLAWIAAQTTPWLCVLAFNAPHQPFHAPPANLHTQNLAGLDPAVTPMPFFHAAVEAMDREFGRLLLGLGPARANTDVIFLADNGTDGAVAPPQLGPLRAKGSLYDGGTNVPLIFAGPSVQHPGRATTALAHTVDLFPTILQLCGAPLPTASSPRPLDGVSLLPLLADTAQVVRTSVYVEITDTPLGAGYAIKERDYELLRYLQIAPQHQELYDLVADPLAHNDLMTLAPTSAVQGQEHRLEGLLAAIRTDGWVDVYGQGCSGPAGQPRLRAQTMPRIGDWFYQQTVDVALNAGAFAVVAWGDSRDTFAGAPLPREMSALGLPGCHLLQNFLGTVPINAANGYSRAWIAASPALLGAEFFAQSIVADPAANPGGLISSRGLRCVVGS